MFTVSTAVVSFHSIGGISIERHLRATPSDSTVHAAFRTFDIAVSGKGWASIKTVEKNAQEVFDDCKDIVFDGLPAEFESHTARQVFVAAISAVLLTSKGKDGVPKSLNSLLEELHRSTRYLRGLPSPEGRLKSVIGQLFRELIIIIAYAQPKSGSRLSLSSFIKIDVVKRPEVQEHFRHLRWLVDDLQWGFGDFAMTFNLKCPPPSSDEKHAWLRTEFLHRIKERIQMLYGFPRGDSERRFYNATERLVELIDRFAARLCEFEERVVRDTYDKVDRLLQATKATKSSLEMASNVMFEVSRCLCGFSHALDTPKNKIAFARSIIITLCILQTLPSAIQSHATQLTVVSTISKLSILNVEEKSSLNHDGIARLVGDLRLLTVCLGDEKNAQESTFTLMWEEALKQYKSLTSMDLGALATATGAETIEDLQQAIDQNQYALVRDRAKGAEMRQALQPVLGFLHSFAGAFGEAGAFGTLSPSKVIAGSVKAVLDACQEVRDSNDLVFESFKDLSAFLKRMKIHTGSQEDLVPELKLACTELLYQFLIVMGTMYSVVKRGRFNRMVNYLAKSPDCIAIQVREFERMCGNLDGMLLSLIFEATRPTSSQRLTSRRDSVLAEAGSLNSASQPAQYLQPRHWHRVFRGSCVTPAIAISLVVLAAGLTFPAAQLYHRSFTSNHQCE